MNRISYDKLWRIAVYMAWTGVILSSATPATARLATTQEGVYASCGANCFPSPSTPCVEVEEFSYRQTIKMVTPTCSQGGGCNDGMDLVYTETEYSTGRHEAHLQVTCGSMNLYALMACDC